MKITGFNPSILTSHSEDVIRLFEDMGFEIRHQDTNPEGIVSGSVRLKNVSGFAVDVTGTSHFPQDTTVIRMNVDDFDSGYQLLQSHGFQNAMGDEVIIEAKHFKGADMISPSGFRIMLMQHIRKEDK